MLLVTEELRHEIFVTAYAIDPSVGFFFFGSIREELPFDLSD